jgi:hypothetical protein
MNKKDRLREDLQLPMTSELYKKKEGCCCPVCWNVNMFSCDRLDDNGIHPIKDMSCSKYGATWAEEFILTGYTNLIRGDDNG